MDIDGSYKFAKAYNRKVFSILERHINLGKKNTGSPRVDLWCIFVLSQVRLCLNLSYDYLHNQTGNHHNISHLMGILKGFGYERIGLEYQNIYDNVSMLSDELVSEINEVILDFGYGQALKKKYSIALKVR